ncbi:glycosyltransferase family 2 protein [Azospirillum sp. RWY-5-1]|uniref:Glycosyltransferase family 2 protein n=1 Tax=Azospirillum oleiclasticum TaxID=2735135 RepID=A0ABX2TM14_9PROT|nr:glycosyltransferase family 2 protein [Azospirillum oleiclasticum]NYZ18008.1 glycosyltransferase family 2 protein [Azospirillum oleiclasticum]NYZ25167.1 glycosyltransferase family 2 protein [Azospirillum oleiclasticum]
MVLLIDDPDPAVTDTAPVQISVLIPVFNEVENVAPLAAALLPALERLERSFEVVFINDGSTDGTERVLKDVARTDRRVRVINFRRNVGQTAAMMAGIDHARGAVIVPMDGDLQNDPDDIGPLVRKLDEGYDVVSGWRRDRQDAFARRTLPSRIANKLISAISGVHLNDYGCTLKAYRREMLQGFRLYGEMHRFVPIYAHWQGAKLTEMPVRHHPRRFGRSKYGLERIVKVLLDLILVKFLTRYETKPIYVFGLVGLAFMGLAGVSGLYAVYLKLVHGVSFILTPLPLLVTLGFITGVMCVLMGLLAELLVRIYFESQGKSHYTIKSMLNFDGDE